MSKKLFQTLLTTCCTVAPFAMQAATVSVTSTSNANTPGTLPYALLNANNGDTIDMSPIAGQTILLNSPLPAITNSFTIQGAGSVIDGANTYQGLSIAIGNPTINNLTIQNAVSQGGNGGTAQCGGGGGVGGGGALYIHTGNTVTINAVSMNNNKAIGGNGGNGIFAGSNSDESGGGGGGFGGGNGGSSLEIAGPFYYGAGGGGGHPGGGGGASNGTAGADGLYFAGAGGGNDRQVAGNANGFVGGGVFGGGAGSGGNGQTATFGEICGNGGIGIGYDSQYGGGGGGGDEAYAGGDGAGAGGGGGNYYASGNGGPLGGGGGGGYYYPGNGGFGAGGGGSEGPGGLGGGGFLAGGGNGGSSLESAGGGGGSGLGGAIFIQNSATLVVQDGLELSGNSVTAGLGGTAQGGTGSPGTNGLAMGDDIFLRQGGQLVFDVNGSLNVVNPIAGDQSFGPNGAGGVVKAGLGTVILNGANTYAGETHVDSGTLTLNGSVVGNVFVNLNALFSGSAAIGGSVYNYGRVSPGNSIGTMTMTNLILGPTSVLSIEVNDAGQSDQIIASGIADLGGTLEIIPDPGTYTAPITYTIITAAGGVSGSFSAVSTTLPALIHPIYDPTAVLVEVLPLSVLDLSGNALAAATCFLETPYPPGSDGALVLSALLSAPLSEIESAFKYIEPSNYSALAWTQIQNALLVRSSYSQHLELRDLECCCDGLHLWVDGMGQWMQQNAKNDHFGFHDFTGGVTLGADSCCNDYLLGAAFSYTYSDLKWQRAAGHSFINSYYGGLYGSWSQDCFYANIAVIGAYSQYRTYRNLNFSTIDRQARSKHNSWEGLAGGEIGYDWRGAFGCMDLVPFVRVDYVYLSQQKHNETGAGSLDVNVNRHHDQVVQSELGVVFTNRQLCLNWLPNWTIVPLLKLSYINQASVSGRDYGAYFTGSTCNFHVRGWDFQRNLGGVSLAFDAFDCCETIGVSLRYDGQFGSDYWVQSANLSIDYKF